MCIFGEVQEGAWACVGYRGLGVRCIILHIWRQGQFDQWQGTEQKASQGTESNPRCSLIDNITFILLRKHLSIQSKWKLRLSFGAARHFYSWLELMKSCFQNCCCPWWEHLKEELWHGLHPAVTRYLGQCRQPFSLLQSKLSGFCGHFPGLDIPRSLVVTKWIRMTWNARKYRKYAAKCLYLLIWPLISDMWLGASPLWVQRPIKGCRKYSCSLSSLILAERQTFPLSD